MAAPGKEVSFLQSLVVMIRNVVVGYKGTVGDPLTLADIAKIARIEPITLISSNIKSSKDLYNILHGVLNIYAGYYLQAIGILSAQLADVRILKILDKTNPDRDIKTLLTSGYIAYESMGTDDISNNIRTLTLDNCKYRLPMIKKDLYVSDEDFAMEARRRTNKKSSGSGGGGGGGGGGGKPNKQQHRNNHHRNNNQPIINNNIKIPNNSGGGGGGTPSTKWWDDTQVDEENRDSLTVSVRKMDTFEKLGAAIGKVVELKFNVRNESTGNTDEVSITAVIKLDNMIIPSEVVTAITTSNTDEITLSSRFKDAITGRISFIKDFLLCNDLIKQQKKTIIKDPTGYYNQLLKRINNSRLYSALSGNISLAGISAIIVMSEQDENEIQRRIGGKLTNVTTRDIVFNNTSAMMLVVIDESWERVSIYIRDIDGFSQNSFDSFKGQADKESSNISDVLKAFTLGNTAPSF